ncbi:hypothetical protein BMS3Abin07_01611 [bacterium BMS3Abin07]|nr:hypothetical protein BMS3Abin07_01611 [bacterium BMS3Abin07]HDZ87829.1 hypothetical protein [Nitrospirota bacterium]
MNCYHPIFCFTSEGDCLAAELRAGNVHSSDGVLDVTKPLVERYREWFRLFWFRGGVAFAKPEVYEYCENRRISYFIRLPMNEILKELIAEDLNRPMGRPPKSGVKVRVFDIRYQARSWSRERRVVCKIAWHYDELFPWVHHDQFKAFCR